MCGTRTTLVLVVRSASRKHLLDSRPLTRSIVSKKVKRWVTVIRHELLSPMHKVQGPLTGPEFFYGDVEDCDKNIA